MLDMLCSVCVVFRRWEKVLEMCINLGCSLMVLGIKYVFVFLR